MDGPAIGLRLILPGAYQDYWWEWPTAADLGTPLVHVKRAVVEPDGHRQQRRVDLSGAWWRGAVQSAHAGGTLLLDESTKIPFWWSNVLYESWKLWVFSYYFDILLQRLLSSIKARFPYQVFNCWPLNLHMNLFFIIIMRLSISFCNSPHFLLSE